MNVNDLIRLLEKVNTKSADVYLHSSSSVKNAVGAVILEHDMQDDEVTIVIKTDNDT